MTAMISEVYDALRAAGAPEELSKAAAQAVIPAEQAATKADITGLKADIEGLRSELKADLRTSAAEMKSELYRALWLQGGAIVATLAGFGTMLRIWTP